MPVYKVSQKAADDLYQIGLYTEEEWGVAQRDKYLDDIASKFNALAKNPELQTVKKRDDILKGCFSLLVNEHVIIFRKFSYGVRIVRVLHQSMDFHRHLY